METTAPGPVKAGRILLFLQSGFVLLTGLALLGAARRARQGADAAEAAAGGGAFLFGILFIFTAVWLLVLGIKVARLRRSTRSQVLVVEGVLFGLFVLSLGNAPVWGAIGVVLAGSVFALLVMKASKTAFEDRPGTEEQRFDIRDLPDRPPPENERF